MSKTTLAAETLQPAPSCPTWCKSHRRPGAGWNLSPFATSKRCERRRTVRDIDGETATVVVDRFVYIDEGTIVTDAPVIRVECSGLFDQARARRLAEALIEAAALAADDQ